MLNVIDEYTRECLAIRISRRLKAVDVIDALTALFILRGTPGHIRSEFDGPGFDPGDQFPENGPEFVAKAVRDWIAAVGAKTAYIMPGGPWDCGGPENAPVERCPDTGLLRELQLQAPR
jgi:putative transposase